MSLLAVREGGRLSQLLWLSDEWDALGIDLAAVWVVEKYEAEKTAREHEALIAAVMGGAVTGSSSRPHKNGAPDAKMTCRQHSEVPVAKTSKVSVRLAPLVA